MRTVATRKLDGSSLLSNLLLLCTVIIALAPMVLGDRLVLIASTIVMQCGLLLQSLNAFLQRFLS